MLTPDKRDHYRLADHIDVKFRHVSRSQTADDPNLLFRSGETFPVLKELYRLDLESREMLRQIDSKNRDMANFLGNLNRRMELMGQALRMHDGDSVEFESPARISQGGVSFIGEDLIATGSTLALKLSFRDSLLALAAFAEVRHCRLAEDGERYVIGTRFVSLPPQDEQLIARYIIHRQAEERRAMMRSY